MQLKVHDFMLDKRDRSFFKFIKNATDLIFFGILGNFLKLLLEKPH